MWQDTRAMRLYNIINKIMFVIKLYRGMKFVDRLTSIIEPKLIWFKNTQPQNVKPW